MSRRSFLKVSLALFAGLLLPRSLKGGTVYVLNETAERIVSLRRKGLSAERIAEELTKEYDVGYAEAYADVVRFLEVARGLGIV